MMFLWVHWRGPVDTDDDGGMGRHDHQSFQLHRLPTRTSTKCMEIGSVQRGWLRYRSHDGLRQVDGGMERTKEGLVLPQCRQGLPTSSWRLRLKVLRGSVSGALEGRWRLRAIFRRFSQHASARSQVRA